MHRAAIALGSNLSAPAGSREANLAAAVQAVRALGTVVAVSSLLETEPVGTVAQPRFLNGALLLDTPLEPLPLLEALLALEIQLGRDRSHGIAKGPRSIDLDLLLHGDSVVHAERLVLPHPELHRRRFVLQPLAEIAPEMRHPVLQRTMRELLQALPPDQPRQA